MWLTCPSDENNTGKLVLILDRWRGLEWFSVQRELRACFSVSPKDGAAPDQVAGEVTAHQAYNRYGPREREPGDGH
jgi:hypothetical protein